MSSQSYSADISYLDSDHCMASTVLDKAPPLHVSSSFKPIQLMQLTSMTAGSSSKLEHAHGTSIQCSSSRFNGSRSTHCFSRIYSLAPHRSTQITTRSGTLRRWLDRSPWRSMRLNDEKMWWPVLLLPNEQRHYLRLPFNDRHPRKEWV